MNANQNNPLNTLCPRKGWVRNSLVFIASFLLSLIVAAVFTWGLLSLVFGLCDGEAASDPPVLRGGVSQEQYRAELDRVWELGVVCGFVVYGDSLKPGVPPLKDYEEMLERARQLREQKTGVRAVRPAAVEEAP